MFRSKTKFTVLEDPLPNNVMENEPIDDAELDEKTNTFRTSDFKGCSTLLQGERMFMEDHIKRHKMKTLLPQVEYWGIFDGHGGDDVARYLEENMHDRLETELQKSSPHWSDKKHYILDKNIFTKAFEKIDDEMKKSGKFTTSGATGTVITLRKTPEGIDELYIANVGDTTCIASKKGELENLSMDHSPAITDERNRIKKAGGDVNHIRYGWDVVCGPELPMLAVSRAFGDFRGKSNSKLSKNEQIIIAEPFVSGPIDASTLDFVLLASDGVYNGSPEHTKNFILSAKANQKKIEDICKDLAKRGFESRDNIALVLIDIGLIPDNEGLKGIPYLNDTRQNQTQTDSTPKINNNETNPSGNFTSPKQNNGTNNFTTPFVSSNNDTNPNITTPIPSNATRTESKENSGHIEAKTICNFFPLIILIMSLVLKH